MELEETLSCTFCSYCCKLRLDLIKHCLGTHSFEYTFRFRCGIRGCLHCFTFGATFSSFKTHANRKHPNWKEYVNNTDVSVTLPSMETPSLNGAHESYSLNDDDGSFDHTVATLNSASIHYDSTLMNCMITPNIYTPRSAEHTAAIFLLTFQEKYRLSQRAIYFSVGSINSIVDSVLESIKDTIQGSTEIDIGSIS